MATKSLPQQQASFPPLAFDDLLAEANAAELARQVAGLSRVLALALRGLDADPSEIDEHDVRILAEMADTMALLARRAAAPSAGASFRGTPDN
jgi:hypothetical protein